MVVSFKVSLDELTNSNEELRRQKPTNALEPSKKPSLVQRIREILKKRKASITNVASTETVFETTIEAATEESKSSSTSTSEKKNIFLMLQKFKDEGKK